MGVEGPGGVPGGGGGAAGQDVQPDGISRIISAGSYYQIFIFHAGVMNQSSFIYIRRGLE